VSQAQRRTVDDSTGTDCSARQPTSVRAAILHLVAVRFPQANVRGQIPSLPTQPTDVLPGHHRPIYIYSSFSACAWAIACVRLFTPSLT